MEEHWAPLWEDLRNAAERVLAASKQVSDETGHFLGAVVVQQEKTTPGQISTFAIIDGQQRFTTLQVILRASLHVSHSLGLPDEQKLLESLTENPPYSDENDRWKVWPTNADRTNFLDVMRFGAGTRTSQQARVVSVYRFFRSAIDQFCLVEARTEEPSVRFRAIVEAVTKRFRLVVISLSDTDDPHMTFEALNARGAPLLASDLIRNFVFHKVSRAKLSDDQTYEKFWRPFDEDHRALGAPFWKAPVRSGRFEIARLDVFLMNFLVAHLCHEVPISRLYLVFKQWWGTTQTAAEIEAKLDTLKSHAETFAALSGVSRVAEERTYGYWVRVFGTTAAIPFLIAVVSPTDPIAAPSEHEAILANIESFIVRRAICGLPTQGYSRLFLGLLKDARLAGSVDRSWVRQRLSASSTPEHRWPDDAEFLRSWLTAPVYEELDRKIVKAVLKAIDDGMRTAKAEKVIIDEVSLEIEHILPQRWRASDYPLGDPFDVETFRRHQAERERIIHSFGNLTLLTKKLNGHISNGAFAFKRKEIAEQSALRMNVHFQTMQDSDSWDHAAIEARGRKQFEVAVSLWPHSGDGARLAEVRQGLFLPKGSPLVAVRMVEYGRIHKPHVSEIERTGGEGTARDLIKLGFINADSFFEMPSGLDHFGSEECVATQAEMHATLQLVQNMMAHDATIMGTTLGHNIAVRHGIRWTDASKKTYGNRLATWVRWVSKLRATASSHLNTPGIDSTPLAKNPNYWTEMGTRGRRAVLNESGWAEALKLWNDMDLPTDEVIKRIGVAKITIYRHLARHGLPTTRPGAREHTALGPRRSRWVPSVPSSKARIIVTDEMKARAEKMWNDPRFSVEQIKQETGVSVSTLYRKMGPRGTPRFGEKAAVDSGPKQRTYE